MAAITAPGNLFLEAVRAGDITAVETAWARARGSEHDGWKDNLDKAVAVRSIMFILTCL